MQSNTTRLNQNDFNSEVLNGLYKKKKKKRKIFEETKSISDVYKKNYDHEQTEADDVSHCKTEDLNNFGISGEILNGLYTKKKKKHKIFEETKNISDDYVQKSIINKSEKNKSFDVYKKNYDHEQAEADDISNCQTEDLCNFGKNGADLNYERFKKHLKKKKKYKHLMCNETENRVSDWKITNSRLNDMNNETLNELQKKGKKDKLLQKIEEIYCYDIQESVVDKQENNEICGVLNEPNIIDKWKHIDNCKTVDSFALKNNQHNSSKSFNKINKSKREKHMHKNPALEYILEPTIELNKDSNNNLNVEHINRDKEKSIGQKPVEERTSKLCKKSKKQVRSGAKVIANNLLENEKDDCEMHKKEKINQENNIYTSFDAFTCDMNEVPVPFTIPLLHEDETGATIGQEKKAYLEENGVEIFTGKWTKIEDDILTQNFQQFGLEFGVNNPFQLLGINQTKKNMELVKFLKAKHFWLRLGKDLNNRPLRSIYMRARKLFNPFKNQKKLSVEEASDLKSAHQLVGNKWTKIGDMLSRSDCNCHTAYRWYKSGINKGKWTPEEESNLIKAIKSVSGTDDISANNVKNIPWKAVANYVSTRNEFQCHKQWAGHLAWDSSVTERKTWEQQHCGKLIYFIKDKYCFNSESAIDFKELHKHFNEVTPSYISLRKRWLYLKGRVPKELKSNYSKYLNALARMYKEQYKIFATEKK